MRMCESDWCGMCAIVICFVCYCCILCARSNMHVLLRDDCKLMLLLPTPSPLPPPRLQVFIFRIHPCGILCVAQNKTEPKINAKKTHFDIHANGYARVWVSLCSSYFAYAQVFSVQRFSWTLTQTHRHTLTSIQRRILCTHLHIIKAEVTSHKQQPEY